MRQAELVIAIEDTIARLQAWSKAAGHGAADPILLGRVFDRQAQKLGIVLTRVKCDSMPEKED